MKFMQCRKFESKLQSVTGGTSPASTMRPATAPILNEDGRHDAWAYVTQYL